MKTSNIVSSLVERAASKVPAPWGAEALKILKCCAGKVVLVASGEEPGVNEEGVATDSFAFFMCPSLVLFSGFSKVNSSKRMVDFLKALMIKHELDMEIGVYKAKQGILLSTDCERYTIKGMP